MLIFKFVSLSMAELHKMKPVVVDVDSVVCSFSSLSAYRPTIPFEVNVAGGCQPSKNIKLLNSIFGSGRKSMFERCNETVDYGLFVILLITDFNHVEFTIGGDPALPIRVLVSVCTTTVTSDSSSSSSDEEDVIPPSLYNFRQRFMDLIFAPTIQKLSRSSLSKLKGAGDPFAKKLHIHQSDWAKVAFEADRIMVEQELFGEYLYVFPHYFIIFNLVRLQPYYYLIIIGNLDSMLLDTGSNCPRNPSTSIFVGSWTLTTAPSLMYNAILALTSR